MNSVALQDWQFIGILVTVIVSAIGTTAWITRKITKAETDIENLKENLKKAEDFIQYMFRLTHEEAIKSAEKLRNDLASTSTKSKSGDRED
jgi:hypothetical protein